VGNNCRLARSDPITRIGLVSVAALVLVAGAAWAGVIPADVYMVGCIDGSGSGPDESLCCFERLFSLIETAFASVKGSGPDNELLPELRREDSARLVVRADERSEFVDDQASDSLSYRQSGRLAVPLPRRPRGYRQRNLHQPNTVTMVQLREDLAVDLGEGSSVDCHRITSLVYWYTGGNLLHVRV